MDAPRRDPIVVAPTSLAGQSKTAMNGQDDVQDHGAKATLTCRT